MKSSSRNKFLLVLSTLVIALMLGGRLSPLHSVSVDSNTVSSLAARGRVSQIERQWQQEYESYFGLDLVQAPLTTDEIEATLSQLTQQTDKKLALIYVIPKPEELELLLVIPGASAIRKTLPEAGHQTLLSVVHNFRKKVAKQTSRRGYLASAQQLYQWLIAPLEADLDAANIDTLVFCMGPGLRSLPVAAMYDGQAFLVEKYNLGLIPAFNLTNPQHRSLKDAQVLAMGASEFERLQDLPAVPLELAAITQTLWPGEVFLNREFTLNRLKQQLATQSFGIVHLATHAEFQPGTPDNSYIQLWQNERLNLSQLRQLDWRNLPVELLVLSACQTALGDQQAELGFAGLSYQAGVKSSLASLWNVSDVGTLALMKEFYRQLASPEVTTKAEALRRTQMAILDRQIQISDQQLRGAGRALALPEELKEFEGIDLSHPYFWAAFVLVGSPW
ncbi:MAG: CHAT domain-containing protein [Cyanothece sp. SIO1E1]|nr:CHAT domain-containing protein [Cyanothece sp. SIO1E1]